MWRMNTEKQNVTYRISEINSDTTINKQTHLMALNPGKPRWADTRNLQFIFSRWHHLSLLLSLQFPLYHFPPFTPHFPLYHHLVDNHHQNGMVKCIMPTEWSIVAHVSQAQRCGLWAQQSKREKWATMLYLEHSSSFLSFRPLSP